MAESSDPKVDATAVKQVKLTDLTLADRNPRQGQVAKIVDSLREFGQHRPIVAQKDSGQIIAGNHLFLAAKTLGWDKVAVLYVDDDDEKALRRAIADNAVGDSSTWDKELLAELLGETGPVPGFDEREIERLVNSLDDKDDDDVAPVFPIVPQMSERYDYVIVLATNETDSTYLHTRFDLEKEKSYKSEKVGVSHVVTVDKLRELIG